MKAPNPIAASGAVKEALATGGVDKVFQSILAYFVCRGVTVQLISCLISLDSANQVNMFNWTKVEQLNPKE